jgi:NADH:ubiquinone oxidoreductase subunit
LRSQHIGDTKAGRLIGVDSKGNKFYENYEEELPLRTRWVDYNQYYVEPSDIDPGWHAWISYMVDTPPTQDKVLQPKQRSWEQYRDRSNLSFTRGAYKPYST